MASHKLVSSVGAGETIAKPKTTSDKAVAQKTRSSPSRVVKRRLADEPAIPSPAPTYDSLKSFYEPQYLAPAPAIQSFVAGAGRASGGHGLYIDRHFDGWADIAY